MNNKPITELTATEVAELHEKLMAADLQIDEDTFEPYKEVDGRKYYFEAMMDDKASNG